MILLVCQSLSHGPLKHKTMQLHNITQGGGVLLYSKKRNINFLLDIQVTAVMIKGIFLDGGIFTN